jgi:hypothetical protein
MKAGDRRHSRLVWIFRAGLALVVLGFAYRVKVIMPAFDAVQTGARPEEQSAQLSAAISSAAAAEYVIAVGGLLIAGSLGALIARRFGTPR